MRSGVHERSGRGEQLARLEPGLQAREDHRPAAIELGVRALAQLVVGHAQVAAVTDGLDLPGDPRGALALHVLAPERDHALDQLPWRVDLEILAFTQGAGRTLVRHLEAGAGREVRADPVAELVLAPDVRVGDRLPETFRGGADGDLIYRFHGCLLYTSPSPRD